MDDDDGAVPQQVKGTLLLSRYFESETHSLLDTLCLFVTRAQLASDPSEVRDIAREVLAEVVLEALRHADRFDPARQPKAWLLGLAANVIKRQRARLARQARHEVLVGDYDSGLDPDEARRIDDVFDRLVDVVIVRSEPGPEAEVLMEEAIDRLLAPLTEEDRRVVKLAIIEDLDSSALARALGTDTVVAARARLHKALLRLRKEWRKA